MTLVGPTWAAARTAGYAAAEPLPELVVPLTEADGLALATALTAPADLPAFPTASVDGYAVAGPGPWRLTGQVLAGTDASDLIVGPGAAFGIATGAMVPSGAETILRLEDALVTEDARGTTLTGTPRRPTEWRMPGDEAKIGDVLLPAGRTVGPAVIGVAAGCGLDTITARRRPRVAVRVFGDELLATGPPSVGRVRDSLGPSLPGWIRRLGAEPLPVPPPIADTRSAHVTAITEAARDADLVLTTGGTMHGPVDHLHPALDEIGAELIVDTVLVRPGYPMLLARLPGGVLVAGLPGNPLSAIVALLTLAAPVLAGLRGAPYPATSQARLAAGLRGRPGFTRLAPVRTGPDGVADPVPHIGSSMLRGLANATGLAVLSDGADGSAGQLVDVLPLPLLPGELP